MKRNSQEMNKNTLLERDANQPGLGRLQCSSCVSQMLKALIFPEDGRERYSVFPSKFTERLHNSIQTWESWCHFDFEIVILNMSSIHDGMPKYVQVEKSSKFVECTKNCE